MAIKPRRAAKKKKQKSNPTDALQKLVNSEPQIRHIHRLFTEMFKSRNSRGAAILIASYVENSLETALFRRLDVSEKFRRRLFGINGPLGTFAHKIKIALALNIIGPETMANLEHVREIRNAFAHSKISISFRTKQIEDVCALLKIPQDLTVYPYIAKTATSRQRYESVCYITAKNLTRGNALDKDYAVIDPNLWQLHLNQTNKPVPIRAGFDLVMKRQSLP
jgi:DNA-binding MltR family transcriptional regulator